MRRVGIHGAGFVSAVQDGPNVAALGGRCCWLDYDGANTTVSCGTDAQLANLPTSVTGFTWDGWMMARTFGEGGYGQVISKGGSSSPGWRIYWFSGIGVEARTFHPTPAILRVAYAPDSTWHHYTFFLNPADAKWYSALDGTWAGAYVLQSAAAGVYASDAAVNLAIGARGVGLTNSHDGLMGWHRLSTGNRHGYPANFVAPARCTIPTVDGTTKEIWPFSDGTGAVVTALVAAGDNGAILNGTWGCE